jgi:soluble lytic murein transglycosylase-like protein
MSFVRCSLLCLLFLAAPGALAARVEIPLRVPLEVVGKALAAQLAASTAKPNEVYREGPCRYLNLEPPKVEEFEGKLRLTSPGTAALGLEMLGKCQNAADWRGSLQLTLAPRIDSAGILRVRIVDSKLIDERGSDSRAPLIWELSKSQLHPRIERFAYDLGASRAALLAIVRDVAPPEQSAAMEQALQRIEVKDPRVEKTHVVVPITVEIADAWLAPPPAATTSAAPLTETELEALEKALEPWDAFLVYALREIAIDAKSEAFRKRLFTLLLDSRYQLAEILAGDAVAQGDPARALFIDTWNDLHAILADAQRDGVLDPSLIRYALFIDAGDALVALENAAPGLGMRLSADSLRRLARSLRPGETGDPLAIDWSEDQQLHQLFGVEELRDPQPPSDPNIKPRSELDFFIRVAADPAAQEPTLDPWIPTQDELALYEKRVGTLLRESATAELPQAGLAAQHAKTYTNLVPTTALIESCWRQYVVRAGKVTFLRSQSSSVGIMQINQRVWRGFYNVERLRWDTRYNIRAGAQILMRYIKDYAIPYAERTGNATVVPRAAYAVYNAGPRAVGRFDKKPPHPREARVDEKLWALYKGLAAGAQPDLKNCGVKDPG